jgi:hypothetical protein
MFTREVEMIIFGLKIIKKSRHQLREGQYLAALERISVLEQVENNKVEKLKSIGDSLRGGIVTQEYADEIIAELKTIEMIIRISIE